MGIEKYGATAPNGYSQNQVMILVPFVVDLTDMRLLFGF